MATAAVQGIMFAQQSMDTPTEALLMLKAGDGASISIEGASCSARMATKGGAPSQMADSGTVTSVEDDGHGQFDDPEEGKATYGVAEQPSAKRQKRAHAGAADNDGKGPGSSVSSYSSTDADVGAMTKGMAGRQGPTHSVERDHQALVPASSYILHSTQSRGPGSAVAPVQSRLTRTATARGRKPKSPAEGGSQSSRSPPAFLSRRGATGKRPLPTAKTRNSVQQKPPLKRAAAQPTSSLPESSNSEHQAGAQGTSGQEASERGPNSLPDPGPLLHALLFPPSRVAPPGTYAIPSEQLGPAIGARFADHVLIPRRDFDLFRHLLARFHQGPPVAAEAWPSPGHPGPQPPLQRRPLVPTAQATAVPAQRPSAAAQARPQRSVASQSLPKHSAAPKPAAPQPRAGPQAQPQYYPPPSFQPIQPAPGASLKSQSPVKEDKNKKHPVDWHEVADEDVLFGRGGNTNVHVGNRYFRSLVDQFVAQYSAARKGHKKAVATALVAAIRACGGRFLKQDEKNKHWYEVGDEKAIEKATQSLREAAARDKTSGDEESSLEHASSHE